MPKTNLSMWGLVWIESGCWLTASAFLILACCNNLPGISCSNAMLSINADIFMNITMDNEGSKRIIAIVGRARSGKDTVASALVYHAGFGLARMAAPVKAAASALFGIDPGVFESAAKDDVCNVLSPMTPRHALVWLTAATKEWLGDDAFFSRRLLDAACSGRIVIPDVRYAADVAEVRARGGFVIKICRPTLDEAHRLEWETDIDDLPADAVVINDGTIDELVVKAFKALETQLSSY